MKLLLTLLLALNSNIFAADLERNIRPQLPFVNSLENEARVYKLNLSPNSIKINNSYIGKPSNQTSLKIHPPFKKDKYVLRFLDKDENELLSVGIGNPFYANFQHIGFEDREYMGGLVSEANIEIAIPLNINADFIVISSKDPSNNLKDIQRIELP